MGEENGVERDRMREVKREKDRARVADREKDRVREVEQEKEKEAGERASLG